MTERQWVIDELRRVADKLEKDQAASPSYEYSLMPISSFPRLAKLSVWWEVPPTQEEIAAGRRK